MDKETLQQKIVEYFEKLPKEAQEVFSSMSWMETLKNIGVEYKLNDQQIELLGTETTLVLLGIIHVDEYQKIIETELKLSEEIVSKISSEINDNILNSIKGELVNTFESNALALSEQKDTKLIDQNFSALPENVQEAIANSNWKEKLYKIAEKYKLTISQMGMLEEVTKKVMNNEIKPNLYENELALRITILREDISNLVNDVNEEILKRIREVMREQEGVIKNEELRIKNLEEIPLPPYTKTVTNEDEVPKPPKMEIKVENVTPTKYTPNIIEEKLKGVTISDSNISNYPKMKEGNMTNNPNTPKENPLPRSFDPYREAF